MSEMIVPQGPPPHRGGPPVASPHEIELESVERRRGRRLRYGLGAAFLGLILAAGALGLGARTPSEQKSAAQEKAEAQKAEVPSVVATQSEIEALRGEVETLRAKLDASEKRRHAEQARAVEAAVGALDKKIATTRADSTAAAAELSAKLEKTARRMSKLEAARLAAKAPAKTDGKVAGKTQAKGVEIDDTPVGSIPLPPTRPKTSVVAASAKQERRPAATGFVLRGARRGVALVEAHGELIELRPGDLLPGAGRVIAIERRGAGWTVRAERGEVSGLDERRAVAYGPGRFYPGDPPRDWE